MKGKGTMLTYLVDPAEDSNDSAAGAANVSQEAKDLWQQELLPAGESAPLPPLASSGVSSTLLASPFSHHQGEPSSDPSASEA